MSKPQSSGQRNPCVLTSFQPFLRFPIARSSRIRGVVCGTVAAAMCCLASSCPLSPGSGLSEEGPNARIRVATFNTRCIVPEMDDISIATQVVNALEKGAVLCDGTLADIAGGILSVGGLTDDRDESRDRVRERATTIAELIKARQDDFDVIALNEVFLEDAREIFVDELKSIFPYYVEKLEGSTICTEDSGLMLFSRLPLEELGTMGGGPDGTPLFPFYTGWTEYDDCRCEDCLAEKGVGYVRIRNPETGDYYNIFFTHMQADSEACALDDIYATPPPSFSSTRNSQLDEVTAMIQSWIGIEPGYWPGGTNIIVMGDLNVVGTQEEAAFAAGLEAPNNSEWQEKFGPGLYGSYFGGNLSAPDTSSPLYDAWAQTTSPWDPGVTNGSVNRLDYILLNCVPAVGVEPAYRRQFVPHHMTLLPFNEESDHYGVHAVLNRWQPYCMPVEAYAAQDGYSLPGSQTESPDQFTLGPWPNDQFYDMEITVPGGYQWFRFDLPGSYSFSVANGSNLLKQNEASDFDLRVYTATDLTYDIWNYYDEEIDIKEYFPDENSLLSVHPSTIVAKKFLIPNGPFYVRVSPKKDAGTGDYRLYVHRHEGKSKKDAILLPTCCTQEYYQGTAALNDEDMPWFQFNIERPDNPDSHQQLRFIVLWDELSLSGTWVLRLQDENDVVLSESADAQVSSPSVDDNNPAYGESIARHYIEVFYDGLEELSTDPNPRFYLRVARPGLIINGALTSPYETYDMRWETDLTVLHGKAWAGTHALRLKAIDETCIDKGNSDEVGLQVWTDGMLLYDLGYNDIGDEATDMDSGDDVSLEKFIRADGTLARYTQSLQFRVLEYDPGGPDYGEKRTIGALGAQQNKAWKSSSKVSVPCSGCCEDGEYQLFYNRSRTLQYPPCD